MIDHDVIASAAQSRYVTVAAVLSRAVPAAGLGSDVNPRAELAGPHQAVFDVRQLCDKRHGGSGAGCWRSD